MAQRPPREAEPQAQGSYPPERLHSSPQPVAAYYAPFPPYAPYGSAVIAGEENLQPFRQLAAAVSVSQAMPPFAFRTAPPFLSPGLALPRDPLYELPWAGKLPPWYPFPAFPREAQRALGGSCEDSGAATEGLAHAGGRSGGGPGYGPEIAIPTTPVDSPLLASGLQTSQPFLCFPSKPPEEGPKPLHREDGESAPRYHFTQEDLHLVLYGVIPSPEPSAVPRHAASGLLVPAHNSGSDSLPQTLDQDTLQLPEGLCLRQMLFGEVPHFSVFCCTFIANGVRFGPFQGKVVNASEVKTCGDNSLMWEIFEDGHLSHFIDGKGSTGNWMSHVNCARFPKEQNLVAVQCEGQIFYESCKEIYQNQELLVWYGDCYEKFLDVPVSLHQTEQGKQASGPSEESAEGYKCDRCGKVFTYRYYRDKHLKYTPCVDKGDRKFPCSLCKRSFEKRDRLRIHILHVHEKHRPHKCSTCGKCFSQSSSLNKHMRVHSGDRPYQCVYCTKKFTASSILRTHIRQHSGEKPFKCKHCGKSFASHAAHDSHVRRSHKEVVGGTPGVCGKTFPAPETVYSHVTSREDY